jgi:hypothetical protein
MEIEMTNLNDLLNDFNAERIAEITKSEARAKSAEWAAAAARQIETGIRGADGKLIIPEGFEEDDEDEEEEED